MITTFLDYQVAVQKGVKKEIPAALTVPGEIHELAAELRRITETAFKKYGWMLDEVADISLSK